MQRLDVILQRRVPVFDFQSLLKALLEKKAESILMERPLGSIVRKGGRLEMAHINLSVD